MAFTKIWPGGAPANGTFTAGEATQLDTDHSNAAHSDNTTDTINSQWTFSTSARGVYQSGYIATWQSGATSTWQAGSTATFQGVVNLTGTSMLIGDGTNPYTIELKNAATLQLDASSNVTASGPITLTGASGKVTTSGGGSVVFANADYPKVTGGHPAQTPKRRIPFAEFPIVSPFSLNAAGLGLDGSNSSAAARFPIPIGPGMWNGLVIATVNVIFTPIGGHGALPANNIQATLRLYTPNVGGAVSLGTLGSTATYTPVSLADYNNGNAKELQLNCGTPTIDTTANCYVLEVVNENGANSIAGMTWHALEMTFTATDLRPA